MAFPASTKIWAETMDPYDIVDYEIDLAPLLTAGETISTTAVTVMTESQLYGLTLGTAAYAPVLGGTNKLKIWLSIDTGFQTNAVFVAGIKLPLEVTITTNSSPSRRKQRTVAVEVIQR